MVPGRRYSVTYVLRRLRRGWWMLLVPLAITAAIAIVLAKALPDVYYAQATVRVIPPRLPDNYVKGQVTLSLPERVQAASQAVLTLPQMEQLITEFDVYPTLRSRVPKDVLASWFRSSIRITPAPKGDTFTVGYYGYSRTRVKRVTERLTALIVQETTKQRETLADNTGEFFQTELDLARQRLEQQEQKVADYRRRYAGQLPTQVETNLRMMQAASTELQGVEEALNRDRSRRDELARELEAATAAETPPATPEPEVADPPPGDPTATLPPGPPSKQLRAARALRARMLRRFTPEYPDVQALDRAIAVMEKAAGNAPATSQEQDARAHEAQVRESLKALDAQIAARDAAARRLRDTVNGYRARVDAVPEREAEWASLTRDYNTLQGVYQGLLAKREESRIAANVDRQAVGEQIRIVEQPRQPSAPVSPNRKQVVLVGVAVGAGVGILLLVVGELRDRTLRAEEEVLATLNLPVIGLVPLIVTSDDRRRLRRRRLVWTAAALVAGVGLAALRWHR